MCACGCFLIVGVAAGIAYCVIHALWLPAGLIVAAAALTGWFAKKAAGARH
jgi:hypothetical protein